MVRVKCQVQREAVIIHMSACTASPASVRLVFTSARNLLASVRARYIIRNTIRIENEYIPKMKDDFDQYGSLTSDVFGMARLAEV